MQGHRAAPDPFRTLGIPYDATLDDVRAAFRRAALATHPDRAAALRSAGGSGGMGDLDLSRSTAAFRAARAAFDALSTPDRLEASRHRWRPPPTAAVAERVLFEVDVPLRDGTVFGLRMTETT